MCVASPAEVTIVAAGMTKKRRIPSFQAVPRSNKNILSWRLEVEATTTARRTMREGAGKGAGLSPASSLILNLVFAQRPEAGGFL